jgi:hypothetical protein
MDVAKVDWNFAYVAIGCTCILQLSVPSVLSVLLDVCCKVCLSGCCICFTHMLQVFYLDVTCVCNDFQTFFKCFFQLFQKHVSSVSSIFRRMLQLLHLDVSKVDRVLHMRYAWKTERATSGLCAYVQAHVGARNAAGQRAC